jgi:cytochrome c oxidase subunit 1
MGLGLERVKMMSTHQGTFISKYVFSTDHKMIAKQFMWLGLFFLFFGGALAMLIRWQLGYPEQPVPLIGNWMWPGDNGIINPDIYNQMFTMHGTIMIFWAITPLLIGAFGNFIIPLQIGAGDMAFPKLNLISFWTMFLSSLILLSSYLLTTGTAAGGWTSYPPLSSPAGGIPGLGQTIWTVALVFMGSSSMMGAINYITTVVRMRAPGMDYFKMPLSVWGLFLTSILNAVFVPVIAAGLVMLLLDQTIGTEFFLAGRLASGDPGDPLLFQHVFWIFGHPEVYILILPVWGIISDLLSVFSRKPAFGYRVTAIAMCTVTALSTLVWGHHMYTTGMSPLLGKSFMFLTLLISIPSAMFFLNWLGTMWKGSIHFTTPMLFAVGVIWVFGLGGLTGLYNATITADIYLHDTMFVVGHFHYTLAASVLLGSFAAIYFWFPRMFGRKLDSRLGKIHFWGTFISLNFVFFNMMVLGYAGHHRRIYNPNEYSFLEPLAGLNEWISIFSFLLGVFQVVFLINIVWSMSKKERSPQNPWKATTLEWTMDYPIPHGNFEKIPIVYHGPHEYSRPDLKERDWLAQNEIYPV